MAAAQMYYYPETRGFGTASSEGAIAVPTRVHRLMMESLRSGNPVKVDASGVPEPVSALLTKNGMQEAVLEELREQRAPILNALCGVWIDAHAEANAALQASVMQARAFLKDIPADQDVLAVEPGTGPGQGAEYMRQLILYKYRAFAATMPPEVRNAFKAVA